MPTDPLPMPPTARQAKRAAATVRAIVGTLYLQDRRHFQNDIADLVDFFRACSAHAEYVYAPRKKTAPKTPKETPPNGS